MTLSLKHSRSRSASPASSTASSPCGTPQRSPPTPSRKKAPFSIPFFRSAKKTSKQDLSAGAGAAGKSPVSPRTSSLPPSPKSSSQTRDKGKSKQSSECASLAASTSRKSAPDNGRWEIEQVFAQFDANGDGMISSEELQAVLRSLGEDATEEEVDMMVREVDANGDGVIDMEEFMKINRAGVAEAVLEEEMKAAFAIFDCEMTGRITAEGLQAVLQRLDGSRASSMEDCRRMIRSVDRKGVGHVDFDDFKLMMTPLVF